jgi:hypothetical protein
MWGGNMMDTRSNQNWQSVEIEKQTELYWGRTLDNLRVNKKDITIYNISSVRARNEIGPAGIRN